MAPRISVFLPTYQHAAFIADAIESVLAQNVPDLEIVVGDDASTDGTPEIVRDYARRHPGLFKLLLSDVNRGITANTNRVLAACEGEFIAWFSGDDLWLPGKLARQLDWFAAHPDACICYSNVEIFDSRTGATLGLHHHRDNPFRSGGVEILLEGNWYFNGLSVMGRRSACPPHGYDPRLKYVSDWVFWVEMAARGGHIGYVPEVLARYRRHDRNISSDHVRLLPDQLLALDLIATQYPALKRHIDLRRPALFCEHAWMAFLTRRYDDVPPLLAQAAQSGLATATATTSWRARFLAAFFLKHPRVLAAAGHWRERWTRLKRRWIAGRSAPA